MRGHSGGNKALEANPNHTNNTQTHLCHHSSISGLIRWVVWLSHFKRASKLLHKQSESGPLHREYLPSSISSTAHCDTGERNAFQRAKITAAEYTSNSTALLACCHGAGVRQRKAM